MDARDWPALGRPGDVLRRRAPRSEVKGDRKLRSLRPWCACAEARRPATRPLWVRERGASGGAASRCRFLPPAGRHLHSWGWALWACL